jgi:hypothetical protein
MTNRNHPLFFVFHKYSRTINSCFSFASYECHTYDINQYGYEAMVVEGQIRHRTAHIEERVDKRSRLYN